MSSKPAKSRIITIRLPSTTLSRFPADLSAAAAQPSRPASSLDTPAPDVVEPTPATSTPADSASAMNGTSPPASQAPTAAATNGKKKGPGPKAGAKRAAPAAEPGTKTRGKPGPKKKQKLGDMINDPNNKTPFAGPTPIHKLGPKANQGAINAGLRALDRTGKFKARKWEKKGFKLRSFTGVVWDLPSWKAPLRTAAFSEDVKSDSTGSSESKVKDESSALSEKSGLLGTTPVPQGALASSPAPVAA